MPDRPLAAVVLAAGQGTRMRAPGPKVLVQACGRALVEHVLDALRPLGAQPVVVVYGFGGNAVKDALANRELAFAHQPEQRGTGHAVQCALPALDGFAGDVLVLCGDTPLLTTEVLEALVADHRSEDRALTVLSASLKDPGSLGRILRGADGRMAGIREVADASAEERTIHEINTGVMIIDGPRLAGALERLTPDNAQGEYYLTDVPRLLMDDGLAVEAFMTEDEGSALGVNNPLELAEAVGLLQGRARDRLLVAGVWMEDAESVRIDAGVEIGARTTVKAFTHIGPDVRIGGGCTIGPFADLREGVVVEDGAVVGSHVVIRRSTLGPGARIDGPARVCGAAVGAGAHLAAGVVTSFEEKGRIVIGEHARIGAGVVLEAPVTVGENAQIEAGRVSGREGDGDA